MWLDKNLVVTQTQLSLSVTDSSPQTRTMRQTADGRLTGLRQNTPDICGETLSNTNIAPAAFSLNQSNVVCLPLVSDGQQLIWVYSNQINLQMDGAAELDKAFDRFPYLTQNQTAALAERCSLHPDQVKVWFMVQRLRYGISWDYKDILKLQRQFKSSRANKKLQKDREKNDEWERKGNESGGKRDREVREEVEKKMEQEQPMKEEKGRKVELEGDKRNSRKKWKRTTVTDKTGKKRKVDEGLVQRAGTVEKTDDEADHDHDSTKSKTTQVEMTPFTRKKKRMIAEKRLLSVPEWPAHKSFVVIDEALESGPLLSETPNIRRTPVESGVVEKLEDELHAQSTNQNSDATDMRLNELKEVLSAPVVTGGGPPLHTKTRAQLAKMKLAFSHCQYPDNEDYNRLAMLIGVPRYMLVQWFSDMRYYIKKGKPRWLSEEQHSRALANVRYRQCLRMLAKSRPCDCTRKACWKTKLERTESRGKDESAQVSSE